MKLPVYCYDEIINECVNVFVKHDIRNIPIDCFEIANKMGIRLKPYSTLSEESLNKAMSISVDGFVIIKPEGVQPFITLQRYIFYNDDMPPKRVKFTIMHELGHIVLNHSEGSDLAEAEANLFAKYSLAPPPLVHKTSPNDYLDIAATYEISEEYASYAMSYYKKWLWCGKQDYTNIEMKLLKQFQKAI